MNCKVCGNKAMEEVCPDGDGWDGGWETTWICPSCNAHVEIREEKKGRNENKTTKCYKGDGGRLW